MRHLNIRKPLFESYTNLDEAIVFMAARHQLYLIGGTAIDLYCRRYGVQNNRHRSKNDIDFLSFAPNSAQTQEYVRKLLEQYWFKTEIESDYMISLTNHNLEIDVDILIDYDQSNTQYCTTVSGIAVMSPSYMTYNKLDRYFRSSNECRKQIDLEDIRTLLLIMDKIGESEFSSLEDMIAKNPYSDPMVNIVNKLVDELK